MRGIALALVVALAAETAAQSQAPQTRSPVSSDAVGPRDEIICRRFLRTGTLADYYRTCKTRGEWDRERRNIRQGLSNSDSCRFRYSGNSSLCPL